MRRLKIQNPHREMKTSTSAWGKMDAGLYDPVCPEDPDEIVEDEEFEEIMPPCKECETHFYYRRSTFNHFDALFVLISMGTLVADIATDTLVTVQYFKSPNPHSNAWASLTLAFTLGPSIVMQIFSASWYVADEDMTRWRWLMHLFQLAPLQRYLRVFRTGLIARKSDDPIDFQRLHHQQSDVAMLRLFEAFLESAPQVVLQLYIKMATHDENLYTGISALVSLFSLCWAMVAYSKNHRKVRNDKNVMSVPGLVLQTIWRIGMISSRVMALVLFASFCKIYIFVFAAIHWFCMTTWVYLQNTDFCDSWVEERIFNGVIGVIYIFCFFNLKEGNSRYRVLFFYAIMFGENVLLITIWYKYRDADMPVEDWYDPVGFGIVFGGFAIGVTSMLFYYRFFHPRGSGAILLFKKAKHEDAHHLTPKHRPPRESIDQAEISRCTRSPTPRRRSPHKSPGASPIAYPITTRSLTPCKYSPLKSDGELPYDRYGMRRRSPQNRSQSEACINKSYSPNMVTPIQRQGRVHSESTVTPFQRQGRVHSESFCSHDRTPVETANFEFSGFATDLVKQFDKKLDKACVSAISSHCNCSYGSYGFDVEAQNTSQSHSDMSTTMKSEHKVMVHASSSQPDMRQAVKTMVHEHDQSSVLLEPVPSTAKRGGSLSKIKNAYEVQNMYHEMMSEDSEERRKPTSKRQLKFGQQATPRPSPPIGSAIKRTPNPTCPYHRQVSAQKSRSLPPLRQQTWQVCEINSEPQKSQVHNISRGLPKVPLQPEVKVQQPQPLNNQVQNKLKIPHDTSKAERAMLKCGEKRKFSFREKVPAASLKAMRFTPKAPRMAPPGYGGAEPGSPIWRLRDLNTRLWQPKTVDIYQPKVNNLPQAKVVSQPFDNYTQFNFSAGKLDQTAHRSSFNSDADNSSPQFNSGNFYTIFAPPTQTKATNQTNNATPVPSAGNISTISSQGFSTCNLRKSFEYSRKKKSPQGNPNSTGKSEYIYATIEEEESENHDYSDLVSRSGCSSAGGSSGKKRKLSPGADLPQKDLKESQQTAHPITPLTPTKSYRLADRNLENSPHRHLSTVKSNKTKSRLQYTGSNNPFNNTDVYVSMDQIKPNLDVFSNKVQSSSRAAAEPNLNRKEPVSTYNIPARPAEPKPKTKEPVPIYDVPTPFPKQPSLSLPKPPELRSTKTTTLEKTGATLIRSDRDLSTLPKKDVNERSSQQDLTTASASNLSAASELHLDAQIIVSSSMSAINAIQPEQPSSSRNSESTSQEKKSSKTKKSSDKKSASSLELSQGKSQSLPEINSTSKDTMAKVKKGIKPKAHSDNRETMKQPSSSGGGRKPLASLQNTSNTSLPNRASTSNKPSSKEKPSCKFIKPMSPINNARPLMESTPALPDCRKLLRFESTGAKPKTKPQVVRSDSVKTSRKPSLSPVESVSPSSPDENDENSSSSLPFPFELTTPIQVRNDDESRLILTGASIMESRLRERIGRYDPNAFRSGKENLAMARVFDMLSPTDSFVSSLAFQVTIEPRRHVSFEPHQQMSFEPRRLNIPPQKPPRMSLTKIPRNMVADNVAKFSNGSDT